MADPAPRYTARTDRIPHDLRRLGIVAWIADAAHPDDLDAGDLSCCWCHDIRDAERIAAGLNRDELFRQRLRETVVDGVA